MFTGTADALIAAGIISPQELVPQKGRTEGRTVFLPDGQPCPLNYRAWRDPGYRVVLSLGDGSYSVEVTVAKELQVSRRKAERAEQMAAEYEVRQRRINEELAEKGDELRKWTLRHRFESWCESWEGTKAQLQAVGLGLGTRFPGEPGAPEYVHCKCPLGFDVRISIPTHEPVKAAAGIFTAHSRYLAHEENGESEEPTQFTPGVLLEPWHQWSPGRDTYIGTAQALVDAGLIPSSSLFPGQPGRPKTQVAYGTDWRPCPSGRRGEWRATICKRGSKKFSVEVPVSEEEAQRRRDIIDGKQKATKEREAALAKERRKLREIASAKGKGFEQFRAERASEIEMDLHLIWRTLSRPDGALRFDIPEDSELWDELAEAFQTIRDAVESAGVIVDKELDGELRKRLKLTAARNDKGVQSLLHDATHLRLVHSAPTKEQG